MRPLTHINYSTALSSGVNDFQHDLPVLYDFGAHFVITQAGAKIPKQRAWQKRPASLDSALDSAPDVGLVPSSLGMSVLDVDRGNPSELIELTQPLAKVSTPSGGMHLFYSDRKRRHNAKWQALGCSGDVRSARGYVKLYQTGKLSLALVSGVQADFPSEILENPARHAPTNASYPDSIESLRINPKDGVIQPEPVLDLPKATIGERNVSLFAVLRLWAYRQDMGADFGGWYDRVRAYARELNQSLIMPLSDGEVLQTAWSVAKWTWNMEALRAAKRQRADAQLRKLRARTESEWTSLLYKSFERDAQNEQP